MSAVEGRLSGRLECLLHRAEQTGRLEALERLHAEAVADPEVSAHVSMFVECGIEALRSRSRPVEDSVPVWDALRARAERALDPADTTLMSIRSFQAQYTRRRGRPEDLDAGIAMYRQEWELRREHLGEDDHRTQMTRANLGLAIRERARPGDLAEALRILEQEMSDRLCRYLGTHPFTWDVQTVLAQTYVRAAEADDDPGRCRDHATKGLELARLVAVQRRRRFGWADAATLRAQLVQAHALLLLGRADEAVPEIRHVRTAAGVRQVSLDPGWAEFLLASGLMAQGDAAALRIAERALGLRESHYPRGSRQVTEARALVVALRDPATR
jgi:hypothetical protein